MLDIILNIILLLAKSATKKTSAIKTTTKNADSVTLESEKNAFARKDTECHRTMPTNVNSASIAAMPTISATTLKKNVFFSPFTTFVVTALVFQI